MTAMVPHQQKNSGEHHFWQRLCYDVINVQSTMWPFCYDQLTNSGGEPFSKWGAQEHVKRTKKDFFH